MNPDSPWLRGAVIIASMFAIYEGMFHGLRIDGVRPDFMLGLAIVAAIVAGPGPGAVAGFVGGMLVDLFVNTPFGLTGLVGCVVAYAIGSIVQTFGPGPRWSIPLLVATASAAAVAAWAVLGTVLGVPALLRPHLVVVAAVIATVNALIALPLASVVRWTFRGTNQRLAA